MNRKTLIISVCLFFIAITFIQAETRTALVIGNGDYTNSPLKNPPNDAQDMSTALKSLGFSVTTLINAGGIEMKRAVRDFGQELARDRNGVGLFYYAGHGMQVNGRNYLIPTDADIQAEDEIQFYAIDAGLVLSKMESAGNRTNIVMLDACRDNPFKRSFRTQSRGLAVINAPKGSLIVYATSPGDVAADGDGRNGVFTGALLKHINTPGVDIEFMLRKVRHDVVISTNHKQTPWTTSSLIKGLYLAGEGEEADKEKNIEVTLDNTLVGNNATCEIFVSTDPMGAELTINGKQVGISPQLISDIPLYSDIIIEARKNTLYGRKEALLKNEGLTDIMLTLKQETGNLIIQSDIAELDVYLNGDFLGKLEAGLFKSIPVGTHKIVLKGQNVYWSGSVLIKSSESTKVEADPKPYGELIYSLPEDVDAEIRGTDFVENISGNGIIERVWTGTYTIDMRDARYIPISIQVSIKKGDTITFSPDLKYTEVYYEQYLTDKLKEYEGFLSSESTLGEEEIRAIRGLFMEYKTITYSFPSIEQNLEDLLEEASKKWFSDRLDKAENMIESGRLISNNELEELIQLNNDITDSQYDFPILAGRVVAIVNKAEKKQQFQDYLSERVILEQEIEELQKKNKDNIVATRVTLGVGLGLSGAALLIEALSEDGFGGETSLAANVIGGIGTANLLSSLIIWAVRPRPIEQEQRLSEITERIEHLKQQLR